MKRFKEMPARSRRRKAYEELFSASALCITGLLVMPSLLFNPSPLFRIVQFLFFWFLCWLAGNKNNPVATILVILGIVGFNLIMPYGRVLYSVGTFNITLGALITGIHRAVTFEGLVMLSRLSIRPDLKIPGGFGALIGESFRFFALILNLKKRITRKNFMEDIDRLMTDLSRDGELQTTANHFTDTAPPPDVEGYPSKNPYRTSASGFGILAIVTAISWFLLALPLTWGFVYGSFHQQ